MQTGLKLVKIHFSQFPNGVAYLPPWLRFLVVLSTLLNSAVAHLLQPIWFRYFSSLLPFFCKGGHLQSLVIRSFGKLSALFLSNFNGHFFLLVRTKKPPSQSMLFLLLPHFYLHFGQSFEASSQNICIFENGALYSLAAAAVYGIIVLLLLTLPRSVPMTWFRNCYSCCCCCCSPCTTMGCGCGKQNQTKGSSSNISNSTDTYDEELFSAQTVADETGTLASTLATEPSTVGRGWFRFGPTAPAASAKTATTTMAIKEKPSNESSSSDVSDLSEAVLLAALAEAAMAKAMLDGQDESDLSINAKDKYYSKNMETTDPPSSSEKKGGRSKKDKKENGTRKSRSRDSDLSDKKATRNGGFGDEHSTGGCAAGVSSQDLMDMWCGDAKHVRSFGYRVRSNVRAFKDELKAKSHARSSKSKNHESRRSRKEG